MKIDKKTIVWSIKLFRSAESRQLTCTFVARQTFQRVLSDNLAFPDERRRDNESQTSVTFIGHFRAAVTTATRHVNSLRTTLCRCRSNRR